MGVGGFRVNMVIQNFLLFIYMQDFVVSIPKSVWQMIFIGTLDIYNTVQKCKCRNCKLTRKVGNCSSEYR